MFGAIPLIMQWISLLPALSNGSKEVAEAYATIKAAAQAQGIEADTALLDGVIADAAARKAREDAILDGGN